MESPKQYGARVNDALVAVIDDVRWEQHVGSHRELARRAGWNHTYLQNRMKAGGTPFTVPDVVAVAKALATTPAALLERAVELAGPAVIEADSVTIDLPTARAPRKRRARDSES